jgi:hypothetical protein
MAAISNGDFSPAKARGTVFRTGDLGLAALDRAMAMREHDVQ